MISYFFLHGDSHQGKPASETLQDLLMINISGKNQLISFFLITIAIKESYYLRLPLLVG